MIIDRRQFVTSISGLCCAATLQAAEPVQPRLVVLLVAGQFRTTYFEQRHWSFGTGGFRHLLRDSAFYPDCRLTSSSFNASSLATLLTGAQPAVHGIIAERWFDRQTRQPAESQGALLAGTLSPEFRSEDSRNRIFSVAFDAPPAELLSAGQAGQVFFLDKEGRFRSAAEPPKWLENFRKSYDPESSRDAKWFALGAVKDAPPLRVLAYDSARPAEYVALFRSSPLGQAMQFALLRELLTQEKLGRGPGRDLLLVHLDSLNDLGQQTGADSPLIGEMVTHMDRQMESFFELLDSRAGAGNYQLVFVGAHGLANRPASYVAHSGQEIVDIVNTALGKKAVEAYFYPFLYLRPMENDMRRVRVAAARALLAAGVARSYLTVDGDSSHTGDWRFRMQNSFNAVRSGDLMISYPPQVFEKFGDTEAIGYGSLYNYDICVPAAFFGPGFRRGLFPQTVESIDIVPTLARAAGIGLPSSSTGRVLYGALSPARFY